MLILRSLKIIIITLLFLPASLLAQKYDNTWESIDSRPIPGWFEDAKFGIFIHWGVYSVPAWRKIESARYASYAEWYYARVMYNTDNGGKEFHSSNYGDDFEYRDFAPLFKAELFNPGEWAELFKRSGAKYVVLTSKHHDGYCLWPTLSPYRKNWNSMDIGPGKDLLGELSAAVKSSGLKMGFYYSIIEWESSWTHRTESGYYLPQEIINKYKIPDEDYVNKHLMPQLKELVQAYEPSIIFSDGGEWDGSADYLKTKEFLSWLYSDSPVKNEVVVNDRFAKDMPGNHGDYFSSEYKDADADSFKKPWEESRGIGGSYGFNRAESIEDYSSSKDLIIELIDIVSRGGNLLLNVGPTADGRIPVIMQERLLDIGKWLGVNGDAIFGCRKQMLANEKGDQQKLYFTRKDNVVYCLFTEWEDYIDISLQTDKNIEDISFLGLDDEISWIVNNEGVLRVEIPKVNIDDIPCMYAWSIRIELAQ